MISVAEKKPASLPTSEPYLVIRPRYVPGLDVLGRSVRHARHMVALALANDDEVVENVGARVSETLRADIVDVLGELAANAVQLSQGEQVRHLTRVALWFSPGRIDVGAGDSSSTFNDDGRSAADVATTNADDATVHSESASSDDPPEHG
ncbi:MAG TPA: hypothetical protein VMB52_05860 [Verrucomicrobiae bacterium]|nr:hypothetical protein [Verrucomicrobiae bacterium]